MAIQVEVTQEDIDRGELCSCLACPVALAVLRAMRASSVHAARREIGIRRRPGQRPDYVPTPDAIRDFMDSFDEFGPSGVRPFSFSLDIETPA